MVGPKVEEALGNEMKFLHRNAGSEGVTLVEVTTFGKDVNFMQRVSRESGVNIVAGAGYYVAQAMTDSVRSMTEEDLYRAMRAEMYDGVEGSSLSTEESVRCGVIGEIASVWPIDPFEKRCLRAAAQIQEQDRSIPVIIHPGRDREAPFEIMRIFQVSF